MIHELKTLPEYFNAVVSGDKPFEIRTDDRGFKEGDYLALNEFENGKYTGRSCMVYVGYILRDFEGLVTNYIIMSIKPCQICPVSSYGVPLVKGAAQK